MFRTKSYLLFGTKIRSGKGTWLLELPARRAMATHTFQLFLYLLPGVVFRG